jgi:hypothetical protein
MAPPAIPLNPVPLGFFDLCMFFNLPGAPHLDFEMWETRYLNRPFLGFPKK